MKKKKAITACVWAMICIVCGVIYSGYEHSRSDASEQAIESGTTAETESEIKADSETKVEINTESNLKSADFDEEILDVKAPDQIIIVVHVCGSIASPGVYTLEEGARVIDCVTAAGGFLKNADEDYLNQAQLLRDGQKVYIPSKQETSSIDIKDTLLQLNNPEETDNNLAIEGKIDLNSATLTELMSLPGIGEAKANSILNYRQEHGRFESIDEIQKITGIKEAVYEKIKELITIR